MNQAYRQYLEEGHQMIDGAYELIERLSPLFDLYIVTNGVSTSQYKRLGDSGLYPFFKDVFVSEDTGFQKPMKEYFDYVFARIPGFSAGHGLIIGDSLSADIKAVRWREWIRAGLIPERKQMSPGSSRRMKFIRLMSCMMC